MEGGGSAVAAALVAQQMRGEEATPTALRNFRGEEVDQQVQEKRRIEREADGAAPAKSAGCVGEAGVDKMEVVRSEAALKTAALAEGAHSTDGLVEGEEGGRRGEPGEEGSSKRE